eukprot:1498820-Pleurochrysis_carterae.AAC.1
MSAKSHCFCFLLASQVCDEPCKALAEGLVGNMALTSTFFLGTHRCLVGVHEAASAFRFAVKTAQFDLISCCALAGIIVKNNGIEELAKMAEVNTTLLSLNLGDLFWGVPALKYTFITRQHVCSQLTCEKARRQRWTTPPTTSQDYRAKAEGQRSAPLRDRSHAVVKFSLPS